MEFDALLLSRIQFAFTIAFHIIFPAFTIGLASWLAALEFNWLRTGNPLYRNLFRFWVKIFAVSFGLGVVSGIVMSYQFGTNWSRFSDFAGNVVGPLIAYEVITAFFLEAALDRKSTRLNSSHANISYAVFCLKKKKNKNYTS